MKTFLLKTGGVRPLMLVLCMLVSMASWGETYTHNFNSGEIKTSAGDVTLSNVLWNQTACTYIGYDSNTNKGIQIGSRNSTTESFSLSTSGINGEITSVKVNTSIASSGTASFTIKVGDVDFLCDGNQSVSPTTTATDYTFTGNGSGTILITYTNTARAFYIKSIEVTYEASDPSDLSVATTTTIDATGINTDIYNGTAAGPLTATVQTDTDGETINGAIVTWSSDNKSVATIDESGNVTLVAAGETTITASYAGVEGQYKASSATYTLTVTNSDPNAKGSVNNPYTVAEAIAAINNNTYNSTTEYYVSGIVSKFYSTDIVSDNNNRYYVSDDGTENNQLLVYKGKGLNQVAFSSADDLLIGDKVVICGKFTVYNSTPEFNADNYLVSRITRTTTSLEFASSVSINMANSATADLAAAVVKAGENTVEGAVITYTIAPAEGLTYENGVLTATEVGEYTITAFYEGDDTYKAAEAVCTVTVVNTGVAAIFVSTNTIEADAAGAEGNITVTYQQLTFDNEIMVVTFCDAEGNEADYGWLTADFDANGNVEYIIEENTTTDARTAYFRIYALDNDANVVYSEIITVTQAGLVIDYATLPFSYAGGTQSDLTSQTGVTTSGLSNDYTSHSPYLVKFANTNDYIQIKTDSRPGVITVGVKMIGGPKTSSITVSGSANGTDFTDIEVLEISGSQNTVLTLKATKKFADDVRYVRLTFTKGSNVGVGPISIEKPIFATLNSYGFATFASTEALDFTDASDYTAWQVTGINNEAINFKQINGAIAAGTGVLLMGTAGEEIELTAAVEGTDISSTNKLIGITKATAIEANQYFGLKGENFVKVNAGTLPAGKAVLRAAEINPEAKALVFRFDETDAIHSIANEQSSMNDGVIYNMAGQRVEKATRGLYIVGGKKVYVK